MKANSLKDLRDVVKRRCSVCNKEKEAYYGNWAEGGSCNRTCEDVLERRRSEYFEKMLHVQQPGND